MSSHKAGAHIVVSGVVQGVGFRFFAERVATRCGLSGYVRNLPNRNVEIEAEGDTGLLTEFIKEMGRGPISSHVRGVQVDWRAFSGKYRDFEIRMW